MTTHFNVENMKCDGCSASVKKALADISAIDSVCVDLKSKTVRVEGQINASEVANIISDAGYPARLK